MKPKRKKQSLKQLIKEAQKAALTLPCYEDGRLIKLDVEAILKYNNIK